MYPLPHEIVAEWLVVYADLHALSVAVLNRISLPEPYPHRLTLSLNYLASVADELEHLATPPSQQSNGHPS
jgi:acyl carrier protein phosphodiesterase